MKRQKEKKEKHFCRECVHAKDLHSLNLKGEPICCKCEFFKWSRLLNWDSCNNFKATM